MSPYLVLLTCLAFGAPPAHAEPPDAPGAADDARYQRGPSAALLRLDPERRRKLQEFRAARSGLQQELLRGSGLLVSLRDGGDAAHELLGRIVDELYELHLRLTTYEAATGRDQQRARAAVTESVDRLFDLRQEARRLHLAVLQARLEGLRTEIDKREGQREELVDAFTVRITTAPRGGF